VRVAVTPKGFHSPLEPAATVGDVLAAADRAVYEAKASGRDAMRLAVLAASSPDDDSPTR
jgi:hypothetical protein